MGRYHLQLRKLTQCPVSFTWGSGCGWRGPACGSRDSLQSGRWAGGPPCTGRTAGQTVHGTDSPGGGRAPPSTPPSLSSWWWDPWWDACHDSVGRWWWWPDRLHWTDRRTEHQQYFILYLTHPTLTQWTGPGPCCQHVKHTFTLITT